ncbi:MAG: acetyl-CoA carboxylase biotin carboxyl carrier protein [Planctomycetota bacterium]|nr:acetyl-CoA carboxylase biotin carboxyl carrier protein [Planctomycetota bacterium]
MAGSSSSNQDIFDVRKIRRLVELMKEHDLNEIDLRQEDMRIQLRRGIAADGGVYPQVAAQAPQMAAPPVAPQPAAAPAAEGEATAADDNYTVITSPMVGTFYSASDPEVAPFVKVGDHIGPETTVCIIEAMKVFNEIPAEVSGKIVAVLGKNGEPVEFGQPLFKVDPQG